MNKQEYLLTCLMEELGEAAFELLKAEDPDHKFLLLRSDGYMTKYPCGLGATADIIEEYIPFLKSEKFKPIMDELIDVLGAWDCLHDNYSLTSNNVERQLPFYIGRVTIRGTVPKYQYYCSDLAAFLLDISKRCSKLLRFGIDHNHPVSGESAKATLEQIMNAFEPFVVILLKKLDYNIDQIDEARKRKYDKIHHYLKQSMENGIVTE